MTYAIYTQQALQQKSIAGLKQIHNEIGCTVEVTDKRCKDAWANAIINHQSAQIQKVAQAELDQHITTQAQAIAPEELRIAEKSFYDYEYYAGDRLIASINYDDNDFVTQRWVVLVDGVEKFRANSWARCHRFVEWHHEETGMQEGIDINPCPSASPTDNRTMAHIFSECQKYGFEILDDGIYQDDIKLGQVGYTNGNWWVIQGSSTHQQYSDSVFDAVRRLCQSQTSLVNSTLSSGEELLDIPFEQLTAQDCQQLQAYELERELVVA